MRLGELWDLARQGLRAASAAMASGDAPLATTDVVAAAAARASVYNGLARTLLVVAAGGVSVDRARTPQLWQALAVHELSRTGRPVDALYAGLRAAAGRPLPPGLTSSSLAVRGLMEAADAVGAGADLLFGHAPAAGTPSSREGVALRAGGALREGMAWVSRIMLDAWEVDGHVPAWLGRSAVSAQGSDMLLRSPAEWTVSSGLDVLANRLAGRGIGSPNLRLLEPVATADSESPVVAGEPAARLRAVCDWLARNADQVDARQVRAATQLGLGITILARRPSRDAWRQATAAAMYLSGPTTIGAAAHVTAELSDLSAKVRDVLYARARQDGSAVGSMGLGPLVPQLATGLRDGLRTAVAAQRLQVSRSGLSKRPVGMIYRYKTVQRTATANDAVVVAIDQALTSVVAPSADGDRQASPARLAFPHPPRLSSPSASAEPVTADVPRSCSRDQGPKL